MKRNLSGLFVICIQILIVGFFFTTIYSKKVSFEKNVITVNNDNLNKIATSVSLLFKEEKVTLVDDLLDDFILSDLPSLDKEEEKEPVKEEKQEIESVPLYLLDTSKYTSNEAMGFKVTDGNKQYDLSDYEFDVVVAVVAGEFDENQNDALGVMSVILNRCDSEIWSRWFGKTPYSQVIASGQFEVYFAGMYKNYMPGGKNYGNAKYNIAKEAVIDGLNGIRNNNYLGFRAWWLSGYSDRYIVRGGNRYGYN